MKLFLPLLVLLVYQELQTDASDLTPFIVGGNSTTIEEHPHQALMECQTSRKSIKRCSGSIITPNLIVTASHCVYHQDPKCMKVYVGHSIARKGQVYQVFEMRSHPLFNFSNYDNDIAIVAVKGTFKFDRNVQPILLAPFDYQLLTGSLVTVTGWGKLKATLYRPSEDLQSVDVKVVQWTKCRNLYLERRGPDGMVDPRPLDRKAFCAGDMEKGMMDACQGDSGAGVTQNGYLVGVVSWGIGCGDPNSPGVYASVKNFRKWLIANQLYYDKMIPEENPISEDSSWRRSFKKPKLRKKHRHKKKRKHVKRPKSLKKVPGASSTLR